ncbi:MAG TPA: hypothetical protein VM121_00115, partial [Acidimicrobiales bacterium]|nr:hypothetical protein [Acidimicrobiales bacterium]
MAQQSDNGMTYVESWSWHLHAADRAPQTVLSHTAIVRRFIRAGYDPATATKLDLASYLLDLR